MYIDINGFIIIKNVSNNCETKEQQMQCWNEWVESEGKKIVAKIIITYSCVFFFLFKNLVFFIQNTSMNGARCLVFETLWSRAFPKKGREREKKTPYT